MPLDRKCLDPSGQAEVGLKLELELGEEDLKDFEAMFAWAAREGALGLEQLEVKYFAKEESGDLVRGLAARQDVAGPVLLPSTLLLSADTEEDLAWTLAMEHRKVVLGIDSFWAPWFRTLPSYDELPSLDIKFAREILLQHFEELPVVASVREWRSAVVTRWAAGIQACQAALGCSDSCSNGEPKLRSHPEEQMPPGSSCLNNSDDDPCQDPLLCLPLLSDLEWADFVVQSRVFVPPPKFCLMPFADMLNASLEGANVEVFQDVEVDLPPPLTKEGDDCEHEEAEEEEEEEEEEGNEEELKKEPLLPVTSKDDEMVEGAPRQNSGGDDDHHHEDDEDDVPKGGDGGGGPAKSFYALLLAEGKTVQRGEELLQGYTRMDNAKRLFRGGFLMPDNPCRLPALSQAAAEKLERLRGSEVTGDLSTAERQLARSLKKLAEEYLAASR